MALYQGPYQAVSLRDMGENAGIAGFESPVLSIEQDEDVATLWLDRPEARNAMGMDLWRDLPRAMDVLSDDNSVRVVVIAAKGPHFSVGLDLKAMGSLLAGGGRAAAVAAATHAPPPWRPGRAVAAPRCMRLQDSITAVAHCPKPVIAAVHGYCIGGGVDLIAACDIRLASADAIFSVREAKVAIVADLGSLQRLPAIISAGHLAELAFTGKDITAERAKEIGLVNDVADRRRGRAQGGPCPGRGDRGELAHRRPGHQGRPRRQRGTHRGRGLDYVATWNAGMLASDDLVEAMTAFMEKRTPKFTGR